MHLEYTAKMSVFLGSTLCREGTVSMVRTIEYKTVEQYGNVVSIESAKGEISGDLVILEGGVSLGNTYNERLLFRGIVNDDGSISGGFSGSFSEDIFMVSSFITYRYHYSIEAGNFTLINSARQFQLGVE